MISRARSTTSRMAKRITHRTAEFLMYDIEVCVVICLFRLLEVHYRFLVYVWPRKDINVA